MTWCGLKTGKRPKKKPKRLALRRTFKAWDGGKRCRRRSDAEVLQKAQECRRKRLSDPTPAEVAMQGILHSMGIQFIREHIVQNGDRFILIDLWLPKWNLAIELDGSGHLLQKRYDHERSLWLARVHKMKVVRFFNQEVLDGTSERRLRGILGLDNP